MPDPADKGTRRQSPSSSSSSPPPSPSTPPRPRWFYAREGSDDWAAFPTVDDKELEKRFQELGGEEWWKVEAGKRREEKREKKRREREEERRGGGGGEDAKGKKVGQEAGEQKQQDKQDGEQDAAAGWTDKLASWIPGLGSSDGDKDQDQKANKEQERQQQSRNDDDADSDSESDDPPFDPSHPPLIEEILSPDSPPHTRRHLVPVLEDHLFDVDLISMHLYPAFFKGVLLKVVRSTWFYWSEMRGSYEPVSWESKFAGELERAWEETRAGELPVEENSEEDGRKTEMVEIRSSKATSSGKGRVCFTSPVEGQVFTEDLRGRIVSLVGGFTVLRGFDEVERRTTGKEDGSDGGVWSRFDLPDMPWMSRGKSGEGEGDDEEGRDAQVNDAVRSTGKAGAAQPGKGKPPSADGGEGESKGSDESANEGFAARLWPSNEAWMRPGYAVRRALGWGDDEAREEAKRSKKQKSTEKTVEPDSEVRKRAHKDRENDDGESDDDSDSEASSEDEDEVADTQDGGPNKAQDTPLDELKDDPVHLVLVIHGIGQGLRDDFESLDFTYDCAKLRSVSKERAQDLGIRRLARGRRAQFLPICWRRGLDFSHRAEGNDNHFGLDDVTNEATMPLVRNVVSKVILDVPFYLSPIYKEKFIKAVVGELNRCYRLWIQRNPGWLEKGGKVSIIGHSLGSVLAADILSRQPMKVPRVDELSSEELGKAGKERLLFDVHHLFLVGSPLGLFLLLGGGQLIARPTTSAKRSVGEDATQDNDGGEDAKYGCMALRGNLYNVYNESDPVAYRLSAAVDRDYAKRLKPMPLPGAVAAILDTLRGPPRMSVSSFFDKERPFASLWGRDDTVQKEEKSEGKEESKEDKGGLTPGEDPPIRWGETRDERVDDEDKDKFVDRAAKKLGDKGEVKEKVDDEVESKDSNKAKARGRHSADSQLPSGIVTPVRVESGHDVKESLPLRLAATANASSSKTTTSSSSTSCPRLRSLLTSYARAERRFRALNAHGCLDYSYVSDVVGRFDSTLTKTTAMLGAHQSYWGSKSFVSLVLSQVFAEEAGGEEGGEGKDGKKKKVVVDTETTLVPQIEKGKERREEKGGKKEKKP